MVVDPWHLAKEIDDLRGQGVEITPENLVVAENAALKLQLDQIRAKRSSMLLDGEGMAVGPRSFSVMSVALDFVF